VIAALVAALATLLVAVVGATLSHRSAQRLRQYEAQLERVDAQLRELYGPMHAMLESTRIAYEHFLNLVRPGAPKFFDEDLPPPDDSQLRQWRRWITIVLQPGNEYIDGLITKNAHLLLDDKLPECLLLFSAHVAGYRVVIKQWADGDYSQLTSVVAHPRAPLSEYAAQSFARLKSTQADLLRLTAKRTWWPRGRL
jgi:hypothetical protein